VQDKGKVVTSPSSPSNESSKSMSFCMHLKDDFSHVISEINPQGSNQPKDNYGKSKGDNNDRRGIASQSGKYGFLCLWLICGRQWSAESSGQQAIFWDNMIVTCFGYNLNYI
jgi:hypothetical protein